MDAKEYQTRTTLTAVYPMQVDKLAYNMQPASIAALFRIGYITLGLSGEAAEISNKVKKVIRDNGGVFDDGIISIIASELGDVMWYVAQMCNELEIDLNGIMEQNLRKLQDRQSRGTLGGSGDDR